MRLVRKIFRKHKTLIISLGFLVFFSTVVTYATPPSSPYTAGATLDPSCAPGDSNCTVNVSSVWSNVTGGINYTGGNVGVNTPNPVEPFQVNGNAAFGDSVTTGNSIRALDLAATNAVLRILRISPDSTTAAPSMEFLHRTTADGTTDVWWDFFANTNGFSIRQRGIPDQVFLTIDPNGTTNIGSSNTITSGVNAFTAGNGNTISNDYAIALGQSNIVSGVTSTALGFGNTAANGYSLAEGYQSQATNYYATAMGSSAVASGVSSVALGAAATASGNNALAFGTDVTASGANSVAIGSSTTASGSSAVAFNGTASGVSSFALGGTASGDSSFAVGATAASFHSIAMGQFNVGGGNATTWISTDPLFEIGDGADGAHLADALSVLKNGYVGIDTAAPSAELDLEKDGAIIAKGTLGSGIAFPTLTSGGTLMEWIPSKSAFRAGTIDNVFPGTQWNDVNVGQYSAAFGYDTEAAASYSFAGGQNVTITSAGSNSFAYGRSGTVSNIQDVSFGSSNTVSGANAGAIGLSNTASGDQSFVADASNVASGTSAVAFNNFSTAAAYDSAVFGRANVGGGTATSWVLTDPLFEVGIGTLNVNNTAVSTRADALLILKNGNTGINLGAGAPSYSLQVGSASVSGIVARFQNSTGTCDINPTGTALSCSSDMTLKTNITNLADNSPWTFNSNITFANQNILDKVLSLNPVNYNWKTEPSGASKHTGFIAQEVQQVFPDLVSQDTHTGLLSLNYIGLIPYTVEAIKEMNVNITSIDDLTKANTWRDALDKWLGDAGNGIKSLVVHDEICVDDQCLTKDDVRQLLQMEKSSAYAGTSSSTSSDPSINTGAGSTQSSDTTPPTPDTVSSTDGGTSSDQTQSPQTQSSGVTTPDTSTQ